jgi:hypothetical protein
MAYGFFFVNGEFVLSVVALGQPTASAPWLTFCEKFNFVRAIGE